MVFRRAQQNTNRRLLVRLLHVAVESFQVELQLAEMLWLELFDLQFKGDQTVECSVEEQQVDGEVTSAHLKRVLAANETEVATQFDQELLELFDQSVFQIGFRMA